MDPHEQRAHDIICMIRYGSPGGSVRTDEVRKVADYLRGGPKRPAAPMVPRVTVPVVPPVAPVVPPPPRIPQVPT